MSRGLSLPALAGAAGPCSGQGCGWAPRLPALPGPVEGAAMPGQGGTVPSPLRAWA